MYSFVQKDCCTKWTNRNNQILQLTQFSILHDGGALREQFGNNPLSANDLELFATMNKLLLRCLASERATLVKFHADFPHCVRLEVVVVHLAGLSKEASIK